MNSCVNSSDKGKPIQFCLFVSFDKVSMALGSLVPALLRSNKEGRRQRAFVVNFFSFELNRLFDKQGCLCLVDKKIRDFRQKHAA